jgi:hypothetical protein
MNSMHLLREQVKEEEKKLTQDREDLVTLEDAFKSSEALQKRQSKNLHPMVWAVANEGKNDIYTEQGPQSTMAPSMLEREASPETQPLIRQLWNHLESMDKNVESTHEISDVLNYAKAALDIYSAKALKTAQW